MTRIGERGDTIVEVLIAIAIVSAVIGAAYSASNKNLLNTRQIQEHSEASRLAQQQIEQIRVVASSATQADPPFSFSGQAFCVKEDGTFSALFPRPATGDNDSEYGPLGNGCIGRGSSNFRIYVVQVGQVFETHVKWEGPLGKLQTVNLYYKAYPNVP